MNKKLIFIFILCIIYYLIRKLKKINKFKILSNAIKFNKLVLIKNFIPNNILKKFKKQIMLNNEKDTEVVLLEYINSKFNASNYKKIKFHDFMNNKKYTNKSNIKYQIKSSFKNIDKLNFYFDSIIKKIAYKINKKTNTEFKLSEFRISKKNWSFPYHIDCKYQILLQLNGIRHLNVKNNGKEEKYILYPGDIVYLPIGIFHSVPTTSTEFNVNLNLVDSNRFSVNCTKKFNKLYKKQSKRCKINNCI